MSSPSSHHAAEDVEVGTDADGVDTAALQAVASRLGLEFPTSQQRLQRLAHVLGGTTADGGGFEGDDDVAPTMTSLRPQTTTTHRHAPLDDSVTASEVSDIDLTERGLQQALTQVQLDNRRLLLQLSQAREKETQIAVHSTATKHAVDAAWKELEGLKGRVRTELQHVIPQAKYEELCGTPESQRSLIEEFQLVAFQQLGAATHARSVAETRITELEDALRESTIRTKRLEDNFSSTKAELEREVGILKAQLDLQTHRASNAEEIARNAALTIDVNQAKAARCDRAELDRNHLQEQLAHARDDSATFEAKYRHAAAELIGAKEELQRAQVLLHSAQAEVAFLSRERDALSTRNQDADQRIMRLETALVDAQQHRVESAQATAAEKEALRNTMERHLETELARYRAQYTEDLDRVREASRQAAERELVNLREVRDREAGEVMRLKAELDEAKSALTLQQSTSSARIEQIQVQLYDLRLQLSGKTNEVVRLDLHLREAEGLKERFQMDAECLQRKLDILKEEFYDLKSMHREETSRLQAKLASQEEQLELMKEMEAEAEVYLTNAARSEASDAAGLVADIPASRRITNAISVTRKALALENQVELLKHDKGAAEVRLAKAKAELEMAKEALRGGHSPYALMEEALNRKDAELDRCRSVESTLRNEVAVLEEKLRIALQDVRVLQGHRTELLRIRGYLQQLQTNAAATTTAGSSSPAHQQRRYQPQVDHHDYGYPPLGEEQHHRSEDTASRKPSASSPGHRQPRPFSASTAAPTRNTAANGVAFIGEAIEL